MIINLSQSKFFTQDPDIRFAREYMVPNGTWKELWRRYKLLDYSQGDLRDYLFTKHARKLSWNSINRWIMKTEVYILSKPVLDKGALMVNSELFGEYEQFVMDELTRNIRFSGSMDSSIII